MKKLYLFAAVAGLGLIGAAPPVATAIGTAARDYPPCSRTVTDNCIQRERGVARASTPAPAPAARGGPYEPALDSVVSADYPPCTATRRDRCNQLARHHRVRRAGERG